MSKQEMAMLICSLICNWLTNL